MLDRSEKRRLTSRALTKQVAGHNDASRHYLERRTQFLAAAQTDLARGITTEAILGERLVALAHRIESFRTNPPRTSLMGRLGAELRGKSRDEAFLVGYSARSIDFGRRRMVTRQEISFPADNTRISPTETIDSFWSVEFIVPRAVNTEHCNVYRVEADRHARRILSRERFFAAFVIFHEADGLRAYNCDVTSYTNGQEDPPEITAQKETAEHMLGLAGRALCATNIQVVNRAFV